MEPKNPKLDAAANAQAYWRENVKLLGVLLAIWFAVSFGAGILFVDTLNAVQIGGFKLGFWFAQQGSIIVFVILIFVYAARMRVIEKRFGVSEEAE
jgi:putative solute:sodium symporter small subunit